MKALKRSMLIKRLTKKTRLKRSVFFILSDILLISFSMYGSFWMRFNGEIPLSYGNYIFHFILLSLGIKLFFLFLYDLHRISWRYVSLDELLRTFKALSLSSITLGLGLFLLKSYVPFEGFPRSILLIDYTLSFVLIGSLRISKRLYLNVIGNGMFDLKLKSEIKKKKRILIVGAGSAGEEIAREMLRNRESGYLPFGFIDDDPNKQGIKIHGVKVLGRREDIPEVVKKNNIDEILVAIPSVHSKEIRKIVEIIRNSDGIRNIKILPSITDLIDGKATLSDIHEVGLDDLLGRDPVKIDMDIIGDFIRNKVVLVTGAGGSIGEELSKFIVRFHPNRLIALDNDDTYIFRLNEEASFKGKVIPIIGDIRDKIKIENVFEKYLPNVVFHTAAYKHVPILESFADEAVKTNILGTKIIAELSLNYNVEKFVNISTDKAVNPVSVMGATKLATEEMAKAFNLKNKTKFISVRFGNVLGSRGSVVHIFKRMIEKGGPVVVTHPDMKRYFMIISESILLVLEASAIGEGGEIFVLDMGTPIKIIDLAKEMIRLSGYEPDVNIPIIFTEKRPGEKIVEELWAQHEEVEQTKHQKILSVKSDSQKSKENLIRDIDLLIELSNKSNSNSDIVKLLEKMFPYFKREERNY